MDKMTFVMLEAISHMISNSKDCEVMCAKMMLDKIIEGLRVPDITQIPIAYTPTDRKLAEKIITPEPDNQYLYVTDKGKLKEIKRVIRRDEIGDVVLSEEIEPFSLIELDGKQYTYADAKGKQFNSGKVL